MYVNDEKHYKIEYFAKCFAGKLKHTENTNQIYPLQSQMQNNFRNKNPNFRTFNSMRDH